MPTRPREPRFVRGRNSAIKGSTLFELLIVLVVLATLAALVTQQLGSEAQYSPERTITESTMATCRAAIMGDPTPTGVTVPGYFADTGFLPAGLVDLFERPPAIPVYDLDRKRGWRGPYLRVPTFPYEIELGGGFTELYGQPGEPMIHDGWSRPIVIQFPDPNGDGVITKDDAQYVRLVSAGLNGVINTPSFDPTGTIDVYYPKKHPDNDDVVLYLRVADLRHE